MSIILTMICRPKDVILCEYSDYEGNSQLISRQILQKVTPGQIKGSVIYDK